MVANKIDSIATINYYALTKIYSYKWKEKFIYRLILSCFRILNRQNKPSFPRMRESIQNDSTLKMTYFLIKASCLFTKTQCNITKMLCNFTNNQCKLTKI
jgi:hypothetical protein